jgi:hypothetical protein
VDASPLVNVIVASLIDAVTNKLPVSTVTAEPVSTVKLNVLPSPFSKVKTFNLDEYYPIKKNNKKSYYYYMNKKFFDHINIKEFNINFFSTSCKEESFNSFIIFFISSNFSSKVINNSSISC